MRIESSGLLFLIFMIGWLCCCDSIDQKDADPLLTSEYLSPRIVWDSIAKPCKMTTAIEATGCTRLTDSLLEYPADPSSLSPLRTGILSVDAAYALVYSQYNATALFNKLNIATANLCNHPVDSISRADTLYNQNPYRRDILEKITTSVTQRLMSCESGDSVQIDYLTGICLEYLHLLGHSIDMFPDKISPDDSRLIVLKPLVEELINQKNGLLILKQSVPTSKQSTYVTTQQLLTILPLMEAIDINNDSFSQNEFSELYNTTEFQDLIESIIKIRREVLQLATNENT